MVRRLDGAFSFVVELACLALYGLCWFIESGANARTGGRLRAMPTHLENMPFLPRLARVAEPAWRPEIARSGRPAAVTDLSFDRGGLTRGRASLQRRR
jgi:hypothetical protein